ncbi:DUF192 domain-containing protein [Halorientalis marina]|jgi:uncharacterized membrane protein (UPF0127 family)|uniref:DUF192 domain-containing protein n=1 Tax=Halorientalis marina TaxID=2931976 RepID=UPI001FF3CAF9|nr:DUF192 domain-containing protein [Halorientalis marina]
MRVVHDPEADRRVLAADAEIADGFIAQTVGLMGQSSVPEDYALVFRFGEPPFLYRQFDTVPRRFIHMLFVRMPLDVLWLRDGEVVAVATLSPWTGLGQAKADTVVELPAGAADGVAVGDRVVVENAGGDEGGDDAEGA